MTLETIDPHGAIASAIPPARVIGCVVHASSRVSAPGVVAHTKGNRLIIGEPAGAGTARLAPIAAVLRGAGLDVEESPRIQQAVWYKLWGNMTMNPISALTRATTDLILDDALVARFALAVMAEAKDVGARIGCAIAESGEDRMAVTRRLGAIKTSMLQDVESGHPLELDALLAAPREIATRAGVPTPHMDALHGLARLFDEVRRGDGEKAGAP
jgi:2-dehydropantoate 2-reductase